MRTNAALLNSPSVGRRGWTSKTRERPASGGLIFARELDERLDPFYSQRRCRQSTLPYNRSRERYMGTNPNLLERAIIELISLHLPKCAGTSFRRALERVYTADSIFYDYKDRSVDQTSAINLDPEGFLERHRRDRALILLTRKLFTDTFTSRSTMTSKDAQGLSSFGTRLILP